MLVLGGSDGNLSQVSFEHFLVWSTSKRLAQTWFSRAVKIWQDALSPHCMFLPFFDAHERTITKLHNER